MPFFNRSFVRGAYRKSLLVLIALWITQITAQVSDFQVQSITLDQNGNLAIEFPTAEGSYYLLKRGDTVDLQDKGIDGQIGADGTGVLRDVNVNGEMRAFYIVEKVSVDNPLDMDEDGIDDVFELQYPEFLNPFDASDAGVDFDQDGASNLKEYQDGTDPSLPPLAAARITSVNPVSGEERVNISREAVVYFNTEMDPGLITEDSFFLQVGGTPVPGRVEVSSTNRFATFFPEEVLPTGTQVQLVVDGNVIKDMAGNALDGDGDNIPGGINRTVFRTLSDTRIPGTNVWGYVKDSLTGDPIEGVTIYVNAYPQASTATDDEGYFELMNMPSPEFFVHIVGATAIGVPEDYQYPSMGKPFYSVPGQSVQVSKDGEPFDIFLPLMNLEDVKELSGTEVTAVGFGPGGKQTLTGLFPEVDPSVWDTVCVEIAPNSATDDKGNVSTEAAIIPVPPDRIPEPLPQGLEMPVVISIQTFGATRFDVPAPVIFPNLPDPATGKVLMPGEKTGLWSYDHDAGEWVLQGSMTVSEDGMYLVSDPGVGVTAPGWHGPSNGNSGNEGGGDDDDKDCDTAQQLYNSAVTQCAAGLATGVVELEPGVGCAVSLTLATAGASADCEIDPSGCGVTVAKNAVAGTLGCIPGAGLAVSGIMCVDGVGSALDNLKSCDMTLGGSPPGDTGMEEEEEMQAYFEGNGDFPFVDMAEPTLGSMFDNQVELIRKAKDLVDTATGDPVWWAVPHGELNLLKDYVTSIANAMDPQTPGGVEINSVETADLLAMTRPSHLTDNHVQAYIDRLNRFSNGGMTEQEKTAIIGASNALKDHAEMLNALGWKTPYDGFTRGMAELSLRRAQEINKVKSAPLYYKITNMNNGFIQRGQTNFQGQFNNLILPSSNYFTIEYADPETFKIGSVIFATDVGGSRIDIPRTALRNSVEADSDGDGLRDDLEDVFGSFANNPDSDGDGILDSEEFNSGSNPLDGVALPTGVLTRVVLSSTPTSIEIVSNRAYVTLQDTGLAIVDISDPQLPIIVSEINLPGSCQDVVVDPVNQIALVKSFDGYNQNFEPETGGANFVDVSDPFNPVLLRSIPMEISRILEKDGIFYIAPGLLQENSYLQLFHGASLNQMAALDIGGSVGDMVSYKGNLFVAVGNDLKVYKMNEPGFPMAVNMPLPGNGTFLGDRRLHAENDILYVGTTNGYATMDISDPDNPQILALPDGTNAGITQFASNGSGLLLVSAGSAFFSNSIDIYLLNDPLAVNDRLTTFSSANGSVSDMALSGGLLYMLDSIDGLVVYNYLEFDDQGNAPIISLDLDYLDTDSQTAGIQVTEGNRIFLDPMIRDDFQMRENRWFLNGELMESNRTGHQVFDAVLPKRGVGSNNVTLRVEATDMAGNMGLSEMVVLQLVADTTPPQILLSAPAEGGADNQITSLQVWLNEAMDPASVDLNQISLTRDGDGSQIPFAGVSFDNPQILSIELENPLPFDGYQLNLQTNALSDSGGNPLGSPFDLAFVAYDVAPGSALWISDADGNFSDPANWNFGLRPGRNQAAYIERPTSDPMVLFDVGGFVGSVTIHEPFMFDPGVDNMIVQGTWESTKTGSLKKGRLTIYEQALFAGSMTLEGADLALQDRAEFTSDLVIQSGLLDLTGENADMVISGNLTPGDLGIICRNGATFEAPWITSLGSIDPDLTLNANDTGSRLVLPNLVTLHPPAPGGPSSGSTMEVQAFAGGVVEFPNLETITPGRIQIWSDGEGSILDIPLVSSVSGVDSGTPAFVYAGNSGTITAGPIAMLDYVDLLLDETTSSFLENITTYSNGRMTFSGFNPDLSNFTTLENFSLHANGGSVVEIPGFTNLVLKANNQIVADGENSVIRFPDLQTLTGSQTSASTQLWTQSGGRLEFPSLTTMNGYFQVRSTGENSLIDLTTLTQLTSIETRKSLFTATNGATLSLTNPTILRGDFELTGDGTLSADTITASPGSEIRGPGTLSSNLVNQGLITLNRDTGPVVIDGILSLDSDSRIEVSIGLGTEFTNSGKLEVTGATTLGGTLEIIKRGAYNPKVGDEFEIISFASKSGDFAMTEGLALADGFIGEVVISDSSVVLKVVAAP